MSPEPISGGDLPPANANFAHLTTEQIRSAIAESVSALDPVECKRAIERLRVAVDDIRSSQLILQDVLTILSLLPGTIGKVASALTGI